MRERKTFLISQIIIIYQYLAMSVFLKFIIPRFPPYRVLINPIPNPYKILPISFGGPLNCCTKTKNKIEKQVLRFIFRYLDIEWYVYTPNTSICC